jgi:Tfp pilus assembly protein PilZ
VKANGKPAHLLDLSVAGCGLRTTTMLGIGKSIRIHLPGDQTPLLCVGQVVWTRDEGGSPRTWRAGVQFTQVDEGALEAFIIMHAKV